MVKLFPYAALIAIAVAGSAHASAALTLNFADTKNMTDVPRYQADREIMEEQFRELFDTLSSRLPAGQQLKVDIIDVDLAGEVFPRVAIQNVRVMNGRTDPPRIELRYSIEQDGKVLGSGERKLVNYGYQHGFNSDSDEVFSHEKQLIKDWFHKEFRVPR